MKKILSTLFLLTVILFNALPSKAITYKEASESNKPMAILVYEIGRASCRERV